MKNLLNDLIKFQILTEIIYLNGRIKSNNKVNIYFIKNT